jgi:putative endonuclease
LIRAAQTYLLRYASPPPCRFDVVAIDGDQLQWLKAAFDTG